jgi:predicted methyltransferase
VELSPGGGWYTEILAPFLRDRGKLYAAGYDPKSEVDYYRKSAKRYADKLAANPAVYGKVVVTVLRPPDELAIAPDGSADMVLTFRNLHNWMGSGQAEAVLQAAYRALKPGGVFGVVAHRGDSSVEQDPKAASGYVNQDYAIALVESVGFKLVASAEINANPADTKKHPEGVWTLPPGFELGDVDRDKYAAIGESDRMTLKFVKPAKP